MNKTFVLGALSAATALTIAVPVFAQVSGTTATSSAGTTTSAVGLFTEKRGPRAPLTQAQVQEMVQRDQTFLANIDEMVSVQKSAVQARMTALTAAAAIADETARQEAVKKAHDDFHATMQAAIAANPDLAAAGPMMGMGKGRGGHGHMGRGPGDLAAKLGMTADELKAALDAGKTIEQIATEKGVTLPARPEGRGPGFGFGPRSDDDAAASTDASVQ